MKTAIYARVSTADQHCDLQLTELRGYAERQGWEIAEYVEHASGKGGGKRPVLDQLLRDARLKSFDVVLVWKIDRFGRSVGDFITNLMELDRAGVRFLCPGQAIDTDHRNPFAKAMMHLMAVFAELERDLIVERVNAGVIEYRRAYAHGEIGHRRHSRSGKDLPPGRPKKIFPRDKAAAMRAEGLSWRAIEKALKVSQMTIRRALGQAA